jgi:DNA segregation ATPase FtsK/SpoIIIE, S-DNA-T family
MVSSTRTRATNPSHARASLVARLRAAGERIAALAAALAGPERLRREAVGLALIVVALVSAIVLGRGGDEGQLTSWWWRTLTSSFGWAAPLAPVLAGLAALRALGAQDGPILEARHYLGGFLFMAAVVGLLQIGAGVERIEAGGYFGLAVATLTTRILGELGAGPVLFVGGVLAIFLLAGTDLQTFCDDLRALGRLFGRFLRAVVALLTPLARLLTPGDHARRILPAPDPAAIPAPRPAAPKPTPVAVKQAAPEPEPEPEPTVPIINIPQRPAPTNAGKGAARPAERPAVRSAPLPLPDITQLRYYDDVAPDTHDLQRKARLIEATLSSFRVEARVREVNPGPAVTQFALEPGVGIKVRRITELQNDLALALAAPSIRIEAPVPGLARVGLEIPNEQIATVGLRETIESPAFHRRGLHLPVPLGRDVNGRYVVGDLTKMPHLLIAGATGSGKSVCLNAIIATMLLSRSPDDLKLLMIDPKTVELAGYNGVPHLQCPVVTDMDKVVGALRLTVQEMERRYAIFSRLGVRNLDGYRMKVADEPDAERLPYLVVLVDELADLMMTTPDEVETLLCRITQKARACGIHMIIATQRPSVDVITGLIKANVPSRIAFAVSSLTDSRVILDLPGAERLLGRGDMLYLPPDAAKPQRIQGAFIDDRDVQYLVDHWHGVAPVPHYAPEWLDLPSSGDSDDGGDDDDPLWDQAMEIVRQQGTASASMLQRRLRIGYNRAARLIERMEDEGLIGPADGLRGRPVLIGDE